jgi:hypothetical protein
MQSPCLKAAGNQLYSFGFRFKGAGAGHCFMSFYPAAAPADQACSIGNSTDNISAPDIPSNGNWVQVTYFGTSGSDTANVDIRCSGTAGQGLYDQLFLTTSSTPASPAF